MAWRSDPVLMFSNRPNPDDAAHRTSAAGYEPRRAIAVTASPLTTRAPSAVTAKDSRRRIGAAATLTITMPAAPAANS